MHHFASLKMRAAVALPTIVPAVWSYGKVMLRTLALAGAPAAATPLAAALIPTEWRTTWHMFAGGWASGWLGGWIGVVPGVIISDIPDVILNDSDSAILEGKSVRQFVPMMAAATIGGLIATNVGAMPAALRGSKPHAAYTPALIVLTASGIGAGIGWLLPSVINSPALNKVSTAIDHVSPVGELNHKLHQLTQTLQLDPLLILEPMMLLAPLSISVSVSVAQFATEWQVLARIRSTEPFDNAGYWPALAATSKVVVRWVLIEAALYRVKQTYTQQLTYDVKAALDDKWMERKLSLAVSSHRTPNSTLTAAELAHKKSEDVQSAFGSGCALVLDSYRHLAQTAYGIPYMLAQGKGGVLIGSASVILSLMTNRISAYASKRALQHTNTIKAIENELAEQEKGITSDAESYAQMNAHSLIHAKHKILSAELNHLQKNQATWNQISALLGTSFSRVLFVANSVVTGISLYMAGWIQASSVTGVLWVAYDLSDSLSWSSTNAGAIGQADISAERLTTFNGILSSLSDSIAAGQVSYEALRATSPADKGFCVQNLSYHVRNGRVVVEKLCTPGRLIAMTGPGGWGKTSFFEIMVGAGLTRSFIKPSGRVEFYTADGAMPKIYMTSQGKYFPGRFSLMEHIALQLGYNQTNPYPNEAEIKERLEQLGASSLIPELYKVDNWEPHLSGAQGRDAYITRITTLPEYKYADILLLDEIFTGMDPALKMRAKALIKQYVPNTTTILVIDHDADLKCADSGFYDSKFVITNTTHPNISTIVAQVCKDGEWVYSTESIGSQIANNEGGAHTSNSEMCLAGLADTPPQCK